MTKISLHSVIIGTGSYIPTDKVTNEKFLHHKFYDPNGNQFDKTNEEIITKLEEITGIAERRHITDNLVVSDIAYFAAKDAIESSKADKESFDYIIVAHNFGDVKADNRRSDIVPSIATRVKHKLGIENPKTVAYDILFGCPGWLQAVIQADYYLKSGDAKKALVIGAETISRVSDPHDRDSMIYADGAGATILESRASAQPVGILAHATRTDTVDHAYMLWMQESFDPARTNNEIFLKMDGHKLYQYAISTVPLVVKDSLDKANLTLTDVSKVLIHQANAKLDEAILKRVYKKYGMECTSFDIMPMSISHLGNSSVATLPTLFDMMVKGKLNGHNVKSGDVLVFSSVGAGMNINSMVYRMP
jgi:3-oxoacyl-[acyl-carrier-protein] synthase III